MERKGLIQEEISTGDSLDVEGKEEEEIKGGSRVSTLGN